MTDFMIIILRNHSSLLIQIIENRNI